MPQTLSICLFGAPLDSGNRGVEALGRSVLSGLSAVAPGGRATVFDNGWGLRKGEDFAGLPVEYCGVRRSRRFYRSESWVNVNACLRLPRSHNIAAERIRSCDLVLDISGGDSFSDIYGARRLRTVLLPKRAALTARRPLALLPQTYGPFSDPKAAQRATSVLRSAAVAWSRDRESLGVLEELLGSEFDPLRHRQGVDVAFGLDAREPSIIPSWLQVLLADRGASPVLGMNVSGLLADPRYAGTAFGLAADYEQAMLSVVSQLAEHAQVVLVPHVVAPGGGGESDRPAAQRVRDRLDARVAGRVHIAPEHWHADEIKWLISHFDWFCGARMHATIAALSSATPLCAIAYSRKFKGVFETCDSEDLVIDARAVSTAELTELALHSFDRRADVRRHLRETVPSTVRIAHEQIPTIVQSALEAADG